MTLYNLVEAASTLITYSAIILAIYKSIEAAQLKKNIKRHQRYTRGTIKALRAINRAVDRRTKIAKESEKISVNDLKRFLDYKKSIILRDYHQDLTTAADEFEEDIEQDAVIDFILDTYE